MVYRLYILWNISMKKNKEEQKRLFTILSEHYKHSTNGGKIDVFQCPLCKNEFGFNAIDRGELSLAHVIPNFLEGDVTTLACTKCNNTIGSQIEGVESKRREFWGQLKDRGTIKSRIYTDDRNNYIPADIQINQTNDENIIGFKINNGNPEVISDFEQGIQKSIDIDKKFNFKFDLKLPDWKTARLTYLHAAYLFLFMQFGYHWTNNKCSEKIRLQILNPKFDLVYFCPIDLSIKRNPLLIKTMDHGFPFSLYRANEPSKSRGLLVVFSKIFIEEDTLLAVWMPHVYQNYKFPSSPKFENMQKLPVFRNHDHLTNRDLNYGLLCSIL